MTMSQQHNESYTVRTPPKEPPSCKLHCKEFAAVMICYCPASSAGRLQNPHNIKMLLMHAMYAKFNSSGRQAHAAVSQSSQQYNLKTTPHPAVIKRAITITQKQGLDCQPTAHTTANGTMQQCSQSSNPTVQPSSHKFLCTAVLMRTKL
jgi:hypothetical protein